MPRTIIVEPGQCMEDIALQQYGTVDGVRELFFDNENVFIDGFCTRLAAGTELVIRDEPLDRPVYLTAKKLGIVPATLGDEGPSPLGPDGDYNGDFNNDHFISA
jgi:hypothetical protein